MRPRGISRLLSSSRAQIAPSLMTRCSTHICCADGQQLQSRRNLPSLDHDDLGKVTAGLHAIGSVDWLKRNTVLRPWLAYHLSIVQQRQRDMLFWRLCDRESEQTFVLIPVDAFANFALSLPTKPSIVSFSDLFSRLGALIQPVKVFKFSFREHMPDNDACRQQEVRFLTR